MIKMIKSLAIALVAILMIDISVAWWQHNRAIVVLVNKSGQELSGLSLVVSEKKYDVGRLTSGSSRTVRVFPAGESAISLTFETAAQKKIQWSGGYIESSGGYKSVITIGGDFEVAELSLIHI